MPDEGTVRRSTPTEITIEIFGDSRRTGRCRSCRAPLVWATVVQSGKQLPFNAETFAIFSRRTDDDGRLILRADRRMNHWATCPGAALFR